MNLARDYNVTVIPAENEAPFADVLKKFETLGFNYLSHGVVSADKDVSVYFSNSRWGKIYEEKSLGDKDPSLHFIEQENRVMFPWSSIEKSEVMSLRQETCNIEDGISIYAHASDGGGVVLGLGVKKREDMARLAWNFPKSEIKQAMEELMSVHQEVKDHQA